MEEGPSFLEEVANQGVVSYQEGEGACPSLEHLEEGASVILIVMREGEGEPGSDRLPREAFPGVQIWGEGGTASDRVEEGTGGCPWVGAWEGEALAAAWTSLEEACFQGASLALMTFHPLTGEEGAGPEMREPLVWEAAEEGEGHLQTADEADQ